MHNTPGSPDPPRASESLRGRRRVTSADVARATGLSRTTISFVLNEAPNQSIPETTRSRVFEAAQRLGYRPSPSGRTLRRGRSDIVLFLPSEFPIELPTGSLLRAMSEEFDKHGLTVLTHPRGDLTETELWQRVSPVAVVSLDGFDDAEREAMAEAGIAVAVGLLAETHGPSNHLNVGIGHQQVEYLREHGHTRLGWVGPDDEVLEFFAEGRERGVREACAAAGLPEPRTVRIPRTVDAARAVLDDWRRGPEPVTGICAYNDFWALAVQSAAKLLGGPLPALIGVDDTPIAELTTPPIPSVAHRIRILAVHAADRVAAALAGEPPPAPLTTITYVVDR